MASPPPSASGSPPGPPPEPGSHLGALRKEGQGGGASKNPSRRSISVIITTFNREKHLVECIESVLWADEILVVDSFSTDDSVEQARSYEKVRVLQRKYYGAASQKNWAIDRVQHDWILILDDDERCTPSLRREIEQVLASDTEHEAFTILRLAYFIGKPIRHSGWQNNRAVRLFKKGAGRCPNRRVHTDVVPRSEAPPLQHAMDHYMAEDFVEYTNRIHTYSFWGAAQLWKEGRGAGVSAIAFRSAWRFVRTYFFQLGILDGLHGLVFCLLQAYGTYLKWSILWSWHVQAQEGQEPVLPVFDEDPETWQGSEAVSRNAARKRLRRQSRLRRFGQALGIVKSQESEPGESGARKDSGPA
jgi:hypothetical protein